MERLKNLLLEVTKIILPASKVPKSIQNWVYNVINKNLKEYTLFQAQVLHAKMPWHEADRVYYQMFRLLPSGDAKTVDFSFTRSGLEGDGVVTGKEIEGKTKIPSGFIMVKAGIYPARAEIYTADDAKKLVPQRDSGDVSDDEIMVLYWAKALKAFARPVLRDESVYSKLVQKGLMRKNKSITIQGKNALQIYKERLKKLGRNDLYSFSSSRSGFDDNELRRKYKSFGRNTFSLPTISNVF